MFTIETPRLILRDLLETDIRPFFCLCSEPEITQFQDFLRVDNEELAQDMLKTANVHNNLIPRRSYSLAILRKQDLEWIGWIGYGQADDPSIGDIECGYAISKQYWGNGYMTEALQAVINFCFKETGIGKIYAECIQENFASARVMEKAGLRLELTYPEVDEASGQTTYVLRYSRTRAEWAARTPQLSRLG